MEYYKYQGEGNSSLVFSKPKERIVYRVWKFNKEGTSEDKRKLERRHKLLYSYLKNVIQLFLGQLASGWELVEISRAELDQMQAALNVPHVRPDHRMGTYLDEHCDIALKMPNSCFIHSCKQHHSDLPTFAFEIKPKRGYLATTPNMEKQDDTCVFCMKQYLKLKTGQVKGKSQYCPIDFFSGKRNRMKHSLQMMFENPQNNLRIFKDGQIIFSEEQHNDDFVAFVKKYIFSTPENNQVHSKASVIDALCDIIIDCLLTPRDFLKRQNEKIVAQTSCSAKFYPSEDDYKKLKTFDLQRCAHSSFSAGDIAELPQNSVLRQLLLGQVWAVGGIRTMYPIYKELQKELDDEHLQKHAADTLLDGPYEDFLKPCTAFANQQVNQKVDRLKKYKFARTIMDTSVILAVQALPSLVETDELSKDDHVVHTKCGKWLHYQVDCVDLDPKSLSRMEKWRKEDEELHRLNSCS